MTLTIAEADARLAPIATIMRVESTWVQDRSGERVVTLIAEARASAPGSVTRPSISGIGVSAQADSLDGCCAEIERLITGRPGAVDTEGGR